MDDTPNLKVVEFPEKREDAHWQEETAHWAGEFEELVAEVKAGRIQGFGLFVVKTDGTRFSRLTLHVKAADEMVASAARLYASVLDVDKSGKLW